MFSSEGPKDSLVFVEETREFVCNLATFDLRTAVVETSAQFPRGVNEMEQSGLAAAPCRLVRPPRVAASPCALECKLLQIIDLKDLDGKPADRFVVLGQVVGIHIDDRFIKDGRVDTAALQPLARCGYADYAVVDKVFAIARPTAARRTAAAPAERRTLRWQRLVLYRLICAFRPIGCSHAARRIPARFPGAGA